jgi:hypothetical protein
VCTLAHVFEAAGLATIVFSSIRRVAERMAPPRALHGEFPLGRPLGKPLDPEFQHAVLAAGFALLERAEGPVLEDFPEVIPSTGAEPLVCSLPARFDPDIPAAVNEARALRGAWDRSVAARGRSTVGRVVDADGIPDAVAAFVRICEGTDWQEAGVPGNPILAAHDIRSYYMELAAELADAPPGAWAVERWFYDTTEAGKTLLAARRAIRDAGAPQPLWFYMSPGTEE